MGDEPLEQWGNAATHNQEAVLHTNIQASRYSKGLDSVVEFSELVDEIYSNVRGHRRCVERLSPGTHRTLHETRP